MHSFGVQSFRLAMAMLAVCASTSSAYAYLDPGTGSMILQVLLGGVAGLIVVIKLYWYRFLSLCGLNRQVQASEQLSRKQSVAPDERGRQ